MKIAGKSHSFRFCGVSGSLPPFYEQTVDKKNASHLEVFLCGARGGRTLTVSPPTDFKSVASADSAIAPKGNFRSYFTPIC